MRIVTPSVELIAYTQLPPGAMYDPCSDMARVVEIAGRTSWKSEDKMTLGSAEGFCVRVVNIKKDMSIAEHVSVVLRFVTERYCSHQLVRHRLGGMTQESSHYVNYSKEKFNGEIAVVMPETLPSFGPLYDIWHSSCLHAEQAYLKLIEGGMKHHQARFVLPGCLKTEIVMSYNLRMWRAILEQRTTPNNTAEIVTLTRKAGFILASLCPEIMGDWGPERYDTTKKIPVKSS